MLLLFGYLHITLYFYRYLYHKEFKRLCKSSRVKKPLTLPHHTHTQNPCPGGLQCPKEPQSLRERLTARNVLEKAFCPTWVFQGLFDGH